MEAAARGTDNLLYAFKTAFQAGASLGQICDVLRGVFGVHRAASGPMRRKRGSTGSDDWRKASGPPYHGPNRDVRRRESKEHDMIDSPAERLDARFNRRIAIGATAAFVAGLSQGLPKRGLAAANPIDAPGAVARIAAPFAEIGFNGGLGGLFYTPLGGTLVGGLTADEGGVIETGFRAGFYLPLFESNPKGASGKATTHFCLSRDCCSIRPARPRGRSGIARSQ